MKESAVFTFRYQRNGNHAMEPSTVGHIILRMALERYCKQLWVEARNTMPNCEIFFQVFSETIHTNLKIFSQYGLRMCISIL